MLVWKWFGMATGRLAEEGRRVVNTPVRIDGPLTSTSGLIAATPYAFRLSFRPSAGPLGRQPPAHASLQPGDERLAAQWPAGVLVGSYTAGGPFRWLPGNDHTRQANRAGEPAVQPGICQENAYGVPGFRTTARCFSFRALSHFSWPTTPFRPSEQEKGILDRGKRGSRGFNPSHPRHPRYPRLLLRFGSPNSNAARSGSGRGPVPTPHRVDQIIRPSFHVAR